MTILRSLSSVVHERAERALFIVFVCINVNVSVVHYWESKLHQLIKSVLQTRSRQRESERLCEINMDRNVVEILPQNFLWSCSMDCMSWATLQTGVSVNGDTQTDRSPKMIVHTEITFKLGKLCHVTWRLHRLNKTATVYHFTQSQLQPIIQSLLLFLPFKTKASDPQNVSLLYQLFGECCADVMAWSSVMWLVALQLQTRSRGFTEIAKLFFVELLIICRTVVKIIVHLTLAPHSCLPLHLRTVLMHNGVFNLNWKAGISTSQLENSAVCWCGILKLL